MSRRSLRNKVRLDYEIFNSTGEKLARDNSNSSKMAELNKIQLEERRILRDFEDLVSDFVKTDLELVEEHISEVARLFRKYRDVHDRLELELGDEVYKDSYHKFGENCTNFRKQLKESKSIKRDLEQLEVEKEMRTKIVDQLDLLVCKIEGVAETSISSLTQVEDVRQNIKEMSEHVVNFSYWMKKLSSLIGSEDNSYKGILVEASEYIREGKLKIEDILQKSAMDASQKLDAEKKAVEQERLVEERELSRQQTAIVTRLIQEIMFIEEGLKSLSDLTVSEWTDELLLDSQKALGNLENDCKILSEKITQLYSQMPLTYKDRETILDRHSKEEKACRKSLDLYRNSLRDQIAERNVSKERLSSSASLNIELSKFSGFDSPLDIYTFQNEFEKLFSSKLKTSELSDFLKWNYLEGSALTLVKGLSTAKEIWSRLKEAFGDSEVLLRKKLMEVEKLGPIWKCKDKAKLVQILSKLIYVMIELQDLAKKHDIENDLYHGGAIQRVYEVLGNEQRNKFIRKYAEETLSKKAKWDKLIEFVKSELRVQEEIVLVQKESVPRQKSEEDQKSGDQKSDKDKKSGGGKSYTADSSKKLECSLCGKSDHAITQNYFGKQVVQYFSCKLFVDKSCHERYELVRDKGLCYQCLSPGQSVEYGKHKTGSCYSKFVCKHQSHDRYSRKKHVLLCEDHKNDPKNRSLLEEYKKEHILKCKSIPDFSKEIKISFHSGSYLSDLGVDEGEITDSGIFCLQTIKVKDVHLNLFYDSGCGDLVTSRDCISKLEGVGKASLIVPGPIQLRGVGDVVTVSQHGHYKINLETWEGESVGMRGVCLDQVTHKIPRYPLKKIEQDIRKAYELSGKDPCELPRLPGYVGGDTDLMIGSKYLKYHPIFKFQMPSGLRIYESCFVSSDGSRGVIGGPHGVITQIERKLGGSFVSYFTEQLSLYRYGVKLNLDNRLVSGVSQNFADIDHYQCCSTTEVETVSAKSYACDNCGCAFKSSLKMKRFEAVENAGSEINYRCVKCRECLDCKRSEEVQCISIQEEVEQDMIDRSIIVDPEKGITVATLPFLENPLATLVTNKQTAMSVYKAQVRKLDNNPKDRAEVIESESKMQKLGFVEKIENLTEEQRKQIFDSGLQYFIPWRAVWNPNSMSTPCRLVFDASQVSPSGFSLNSILAKGRNNMNKLVEILIRWFIHRFAFHTDIRKMYNTVRLDEKHWCYQLYLWHDELSPLKEPIVKVIMTLIYGVKSSGNQAESALRKTASLESQRYPIASKTIMKDFYVDDGLSGANTEKGRTQLVNDLQLVLARGCFSAKDFICSGSDPPEGSSSDGVSVKVAGQKWYPKEDKISLVSGDLNFSKKRRGKKSIDSGIPENFTRRDCVGKIAELFDLTGRATPITCAWKLDLRTLVTRRLDWDDMVPSDLKSIWLQNFQTLKDLADVRFERTIVPEDAVNLDINTIGVGDASGELHCAAIYARFLRKNGSYSSQLIFSRSKLVPDGMSIPRAELLAAQLNATIGHIVKLALSDFHKSTIKLTDSQVALFWISNTENPLKQWTRNKVVDIARLTDRESWRYLRSSDNIADMGTRKGFGIPDISPGSRWTVGADWFRKDIWEMPIISVDELRFQQIDIEAIKKESLRPDRLDGYFSQVQSLPPSYMVNSSNSSRKVDTGVLTERYKFAAYIIDPNRFRFRKVVRIYALVVRFVRNFVRKWSRNKTILSSTDSTFCRFSQNILSDFISTEKYVLSCGNTYAVTSRVGELSYVSCKPGLVVCLDKEDISLALNYFFKKCTLEVKQFTSKKLYEKISEERDEILYYKSRILPSQEFGVILKLSDVMLDLTASTFCVPVIDRYSPVAYAIVNEIHWNHPVAKHSGNETVWRYTLKFAFIIDGRELVRSFRKDCTRCRYLAKRTVDVGMGPVSKVNLMLAPAFYVSQVDLFGPLKAYSVHNKRATVNIWFLVFCCCTTGAVCLKVMEDYSTSAFLLGFIRFSCSVGYPKMLLPDEGSQLVKGCKQMQLSFTDIKQRLHVEHGVEYETCPVGGHNMHGKVERKIQHVKQAMSKKLDQERLSILQWETVGDQIANCINDTPLATRYIPLDVEQLDLLTPNRLMLGRNNDRSPAFPLCVSNPDKLVEQNERIMTAWFECWLTSHVPKLIDQPKWFNSDSDVKIGDVVLFLKKEREYAGNYQYGIIKNVEISRDQKIRKVIVEYVNSAEKIKRETRRSVREIVVIHPVEKLGIVRELGEIATWVDMKMKGNSTCTA